MADSVFTRLVQDISPAERRAILDKISGRAEISEEPLTVNDPDRENVDFNEVYNSLGFLARLMIFLKMLFTGRKRGEILERDLIANISRDIQKRNSVIMDFSQNTFLPAFCEELKALKENVEPFILPLREASGQNRPEFIAFLSGLYMEDLQDRLLRETDPYYQLKKISLRGEDITFTPEEWADRENQYLPSSGEITDAEVKRSMDRTLESILDSIPLGGKTLMYEDMKVMFHFINLSLFPFDKLISVFSSGPTDVCSPVAFGRIKDQVVRLVELMWNLKSPPSPMMLRALFLFCQMDKSSAALERETIRRINQAEKALQTIREINKRIPWLFIARYITRNLNYRCAISGGAEDWYALLKAFWKSRTDTEFKAFTANRKEKELRREIRGIFDPLPLREIENYSFPVDGILVQGTYSLSLSLVKSFLVNVFLGVPGECLKKVLIDGVFYKEANRKEYNDGYNAIQKVSGIIENFERRLTPGGDIAGAISAAIHPKEYVPTLLKKRKVMAIIKETNMDAEYLLQGMQGGLTSLYNIVNGILYGEIGGKYDTLSNLPEMGGRANAEFRKNLDDALRKISATNTLLLKLVALEKSWQENRDIREFKETRT